MAQVKFGRCIVPMAVMASLWCFCSAGVAADADERPITVAFRYDDYGYPNAGPIERQVIEAFRERHLRCTFAVVPAFDNVSLSAERGEILRKAVEEGVVDVAQHGLTHQGPESSFAGIDPARQESRIAQGKALLEKIIGREVRLFVPPHNTYDNNTLKVLERLGFAYFSADRLGPAPSGTRLRMLACTSALNDLRRGVQYARTYGRGRTSVIVALLHPDDFAEYNKVRGFLHMGDLGSSLDWVNAQKDIRAVSLNQAFEALNGLTPERLLKNRPISVLARRTPPFLRPYFPCYVYLDSDQAEALSARWVNTLLALYGAVGVVFFLAAFGGGIMLFRRDDGSAGIVCVCASALLVIVSLWSISDGFSWWRELFALSVLGGTCAGAWLAWWRARRRRRAGSVAGTN
jgi:peptidoglycan/xylan/chitin deacetylase (PgdA/CDA1 family)